MRIKKVELKEHFTGYGRGAKPGLKCVVTLAYGEQSHETFAVELQPEAVREVVVLAATKAMDQISLDPESIDVVGSPGEKEPEATAGLAAPEELTTRAIEEPI